MISPPVLGPPSVSADDVTLGQQLPLVPTAAALGEGSCLPATTSSPQIHSPKTPSLRENTCGKIHCFIKVH